jgi:branched-chain amino acid transport system ATP-binding protein
MAIALQARGLTKEFDGFVAVNNVDLSIEKGSIHALIGPNGAGKTTCFNLLTKFLQPSRGTITYEGRDVTRMKPTDIARLGMVRSFQISAIFPELSVLQNVRVALQRTRGESYDFWRSDRILANLNDQARAHLDEVGLADFTNERAAALPYGRKRALEIATTLALAPDMLLLDEPMAGMGREDVTLISQLIRRIAKNRTVLMVEHNLSVVADLSDRITVLARGEILAEGTYAEISNAPEVIEAYIGASHE